MFYEELEFSCCIYCGDFAEEKEHVFPRHAGKGFSKKYYLSYILPACKDCNRMAGGFVAKTIGEKRRYIHKGLRKKYKKILRIPDWTVIELENLSINLRLSIERDLIFRDHINKRLSWRFEELENVSTYCNIRG